MPATAKDAQTILENIKEVSARFAQERSERQQRLELIKADFDLLKDAGFLLTCVPVEDGGIYENVASLVAGYCAKERSLSWPSRSYKEYPRSSEVAPILATRPTGSGKKTCGR